MLSSSPIDVVPLWLLIGIMVIGVLVSIECGYRLGSYRARRPSHELETPVGTMIGATLGLLAFILAFTFGLAADRFEARRKMVVEEANAIGTAYLRAGLLPEEQVPIVREMLKEYVDLRLEAVDKIKLESAVRRSEELHRELWQQAEKAGTKQAESITVGLFIEALNELIDLHATRIQVGIRNRLPLPFYAALCLLAAFSMAGVGYHEGLFKSRRSPITLIMVASFAIVIALVADLDRPQEGLLSVSQEAMLELRESIQEP